MALKCFIFSEKSKRALDRYCHLGYQYWCSRSSLPQLSLVPFGLQINGKNLEYERHNVIVGEIKGSGSEVDMLVVDVDTDNYFKELNVIPTAEHVSGPIPSKQSKRFSRKSFISPEIFIYFFLTNSDPALTPTYILILSYPQHKSKPLKSK